MGTNVSVKPKFKQEPFDRMLRRFRNMVERAGIIKDVKRKEFFEKPSVERNRKNQQMKRTKLNNARKEKEAKLRLKLRRR